MPKTTECPTNFSLSLEFGLLSHAVGGGNHQQSEMAPLLSPGSRASVVFTAFHRARGLALGHTPSPASRAADKLQFVAEMAPPRIDDKLKFVGQERFG